MNYSFQKLNETNERNWENWKKTHEPRQPPQSGWWARTRLLPANMVAVCVTGKNWKAGRPPPSQVPWLSCLTSSFWSLEISSSFSFSCCSSASSLLGSWREKESVKDDADSSDLSAGPYYCQSSPSSLRGWQHTKAWAGWLRPGRSHKCLFVFASVLSIFMSVSSWSLCNKVIMRWAAGARSPVLCAFVGNFCELCSAVWRLFDMTLGCQGTLQERNGKRAGRECHWQN